MTAVGQYCGAVTDAGPVLWGSGRCGASTVGQWQMRGQYCGAVTDAGPVLWGSDRRGASTVGQ